MQMPCQCSVCMQHVCWTTIDMEFACKHVQSCGFCLHAKCMLICFSLHLDAKTYVALQHRLHGPYMLLHDSHKLCMLRSMEGGGFRALHSACMQEMVSALYMRSACKLSYFVLDEIRMQNCMCFLLCACITYITHVA